MDVLFNIFLCLGVVSFAVAILCFFRYHPDQRLGRFMLIVFAAMMFMAICFLLDMRKCDKEQRAQIWRDYDAGVQEAKLLQDAVKDQRADSMVYNLSEAMADRKRIIALSECNCPLHDRP